MLGLLARDQLVAIAPCRGEGVAGGCVVGVRGAVGVGVGVGEAVGGVGAVVHTVGGGGGHLRLAPGMHTR